MPEKKAVSVPPKASTIAVKVSTLGLIMSRSMSDMVEWETPDLTASSRTTRLRRRRSSLSFAPTRDMLHLSLR